MIRRTSPQKGPRQRPLLGHVLQFLVAAGGLFLLAAIFFPADWSVSLTGWSSVAATLLAIAALVGVVAGLGYMLERGDRHLAPSGAEAMQSDGRAPVVYLRPFENETRVSVEERTLARILGEVGPFVAVGKPGDMLPPLGAARFYERDFSGRDGDWQLFVREMLLRAQLVLLVPGQSSGLLWEMVQCREVLVPRRLLVLVAGSAEDYNEFRRIGAQAGLVLPQIAPGAFALRDETEFIGLIAFGPDWAAEFVAFPERPLFGDQRAEDRDHRLREALAPFLGRLGLPMRRA